MQDFGKPKNWMQSLEGQNPDVTILADFKILLS